MPKVVDHEQRRAAIAGALYEVIGTQGFPAVTLRAVAEAGAISIGRVQHYFPTKAALIAYGLDAMVRRAAEAYEHESAKATPESANDSLKYLVMHSIPSSDEARLGISVWYQYLAAAAASPELAARLREVAQGTERHAIELLATTHTEDAARPLVQRLLALADGLGQRVMAGITASADAERLVTEEIDRITVGRP